MLDGPTLRALRELHQVPLGKVARLAGMSHGHLSKVERGEDGRTVTPAVLAGYERATGVRLTGGELAGWRLGDLSPQGRSAYIGQVGALVMGGQPSHAPKRVLAAHRRAGDEPMDPGTVESVTAALETIGPPAAPAAYAVLRLTLSYADPRVTARLARLVAAGAVVAEHFDTARALLLIGLHAAVTADDPDLRALVLADVAKLFAQFDAPADALALLRLGEADERLCDDVRQALAQARAAAERRVRETVTET